MSGCPLTVFTPTYNRSEKLGRLYASLLTQTNKHFEWIIVDDGSGDSTSTIVTYWKKHSPFPIIYIYQNNAGKHVAHNCGAEAATGNYFICVDSDDWLEPCAIETILSDMCSLDGRKGLIYPKYFTTQSNMNAWFPSAVEEIELSDLRMRYGLAIETAIVFNVASLRSHPFSVVNDEKYIPEESAYFDYRNPELFVVRNSAFYCCEYLDDGLTNNIWKNWFRNPIGTKLALAKRYKTACRYNNLYGLRERVSAIVGIESLNMARHECFIDGVPCGWVVALALFPLSALFKAKRYSRFVR